MRATPGSLRWWQETGLICAGGLALAAWLWDGPPPYFVSEREEIDFQAMLETLEMNSVRYVRPLEVVCVNWYDPRRLQNSHRDRPVCSATSAQADAASRAPVSEPVLLRDLPPEDRPFP